MAVRALIDLQPPHLYPLPAVGIKGKVGAEKTGMEHQFAGHFALHTSSSQNWSGEELILNLSILDRSGNVRKTFRFPFEFDGEQMKPLHTEMEKELNQRIGMIDVDFDLVDQNKISTLRLFVGGAEGTDKPYTSSSIVVKRS